MKDGEPKADKVLQVERSNVPGAPGGGRTDSVDPPGVAKEAKIMPGFCLDIGGWQASLRRDTFREG